MGAGDSFNFFAYASDDQTGYAIKLSAAVADQGGFNTVVDPRSVKPWPYGPKNMRHVYGVSADGKRTRCPIATSDNGLYVSGGTFTLHGTTYNVEGAIGEARKLNSIA